jgi:hypothetical protein
MKAELMTVKDVYRGRSSGYVGTYPAAVFLLGVAAAKGTKICIELTFHSPLRRRFYQHPLANAGERNVSAGERR